MAKKGFRNGVSDKAQYAGYKAQNRHRKNKEARILRHLVKHPNDAQSENAVKNISYIRNRKSMGHICKSDPIVMPILNHKQTIEEQLVSLGVTKSRKKYVKKHPRVTR